MKFKCGQCGEVLTRELSSKLVELCEEDENDLIPEGSTLQDNEWSDGEWIINVKDNLSMIEIDDPKRLNGCCALDGCDGPNLVCKSCSAEVATAKTDCWMPSHIVVMKDATDVIV